MTISEIKAAARAQLKNKIFGDYWMIALVVCLITSAVIAAVPGIGTLILSGPMTFGLAYVLLKQARDRQSMNIGDIFCGFKSDFGGLFLINLMTSIFVFLWALLLVIPGIIMGYAYSMAYYVKVDNPEYDWRQCIKGSKELMRGHKWQLFVLDLSFIGWAIVCLFTFGIGYLWLIPYMQVSRTQFYNSICPPKSIPAQPTDGYYDDEPARNDNLDDLVEAMKPISDEEDK